MHDDLDLRVIERHHDADPHYREALRQRVAAILDGSEAPPTSDTANWFETVDLTAERLERDRRRSVVRAAAALVGAAAMVAGLAVVTSRDETQSPADIPVRSTEPTVDETAPVTEPSVDEGVATTDPPAIAPDTPEVFAEIAPGSMVDLPDAPIIARSQSAAVWTGTEMIVWGGQAYGPDTDGWTTFADGAAFNLASGTWRVIAAAPLSARKNPAAAWTGTEMIVWGGDNPGDPDTEQDDVKLHDGAAYSPATDTWRMLPAAPVGSGAAPIMWIDHMWWTDHEAVVVADGTIAAYDPITDSWRHLADTADTATNAELDAYPIWTGDAIVWTCCRGSTSLTRYDVTADSWTVVAGSYAAVVGVPGSDGTTSTLVALPSETGAPTLLLDDDLNPIGQLSAFPGDSSLFGDTIGASAEWVGNEAIFTIWAGVFPYEPTQVWALDPRSQRWRRLDVPVRESLVVAGDVMLAWGDENGPNGEIGFAYRSGTTPADG